MLTFKNEDVYAVVERNLGAEARRELAGLDFQPLSSLEHAVQDHVKFLKESQAIPESVTISGWIYEVETGRIKHLV